MKNKKYNLSTLLATSCVWLSALAIGVSIPGQFSYAQTASPEETQLDGEAPTQPQTEVSEEELQQFAQAYKQIQQIRQDSEVKMVEAVQSEGLSPERFIEISELQQSPQAPQGQETPESPQNAEVTAEEQQGFENAKSKILEIREQSESQMEQAIQQEGLDIPRFNEIVAALQQDPSLRDQVQQLILN